MNSSPWWMYVALVVSLGCGAYIGYRVNKYAAVNYGPRTKLDKWIAMSIGATVMFAATIVVIMLSIGPIS